MSYTASFAFFEAIWDAGITHVFVNLGSDHPSIMEAIVKGQQEKKGQFPRIMTCPSELVALSMADGYARLTGKPQCVIIHVDVGTSALGVAVHNASVGRSPVLIFAGLSPFTIEGEMRGSRSEYIHWLQDVPDQKQIVAQYCRYTGEFKTGKNVKQMVNRALQFATSDPKGPVYLMGAREVMEEPIEPYELDQGLWGAVTTGILPPDAVETIASLLVSAAKPLVITGYTGRNHKTVPELVKLADTIPGFRVLDAGGSDLSFPFSHRGSLGLRHGGHEAIKEADVILVVHCDVPWIPTQCTPRSDAKIVHIDIDPLKQLMPVFYLPAQHRYRADAESSFRQLHSYITSNEKYSQLISSESYSSRGVELAKAHAARLADIAKLAEPPVDENQPAATSFLCAQLKKACPEDTIWCVEAVTNATFVHDQLQVNEPGHWINGGAGGLGWSGGASLGIKLASDYEAGGEGKGKFLCQIVGDGTYLFSVPGSVYWIARRYNLPTLTIVLSNKGWNAPRHSMQLVHPNGYGSKVSNEELNISFSPTPDFSGIAKAAAGNRAWAGCASSVQELRKMIPEAVQSVKNGVLAVLEVRLEGAFTQQDARVEINGGLTSS